LSAISQPSKHPSKRGDNTKIRFPWQMRDRLLASEPRRAWAYSLDAQAAPSERPQAAQADSGQRTVRTASIARSRQPVTDRQALFSKQFHVDHGATLIVTQSARI
jgi:hypothetical protein